MGDFRKLVVWQRSRLLAMRVYQITQGFPASERYGLSSQSRGASVSILANLAEGTGRNGDGEMARFLSIAQGSAAELECHLILALDLGYSTGDETGELLTEVRTIGKMLTRLEHRVRADRRRTLARRG